MTSFCTSSCSPRKETAAFWSNLFSRMNRSTSLNGFVVSMTAAGVACTGRILASRMRPTSAALGLFAWWRAAGSVAWVGYRSHETSTRPGPPRLCGRAVCRSFGGAGRPGGQPVPISV